MRFYRLIRSLKPGLLLLLVALVPPPAAAAADSVYTVAGVAVDVTAETVAKAREAAIGEGHSKALQALFLRIVVEQDLSRVPELSPAEIEPLVRDFSVANERTSAVRYLADMTFRFKSASIRALLRQRSIRFAETQSRPMVVLPIAETPAGTVLWAEPNPWRQAWSARYGGGDLVPLTTPVGDLSDIATIDAARALAGDAAALTAIARRYGSQDVLVSKAAISGDLEADAGTAAISNMRFANGEITDLGSISYRQEAGEDSARFLARVTGAVAGLVQRGWKAQNVIEFGTQGTLLVAAPLRTVSEWLAIQQRLSGLPTVERANLVTLSRSKAELNLIYFGNEQQLTTALAQKGLVLSRTLSGGWLLSLDAGVTSQSTQ